MPRENYLGNKTQHGGEINGIQVRCDCTEEFCSSVRNWGPKFVTGTLKHKPTKQLSPEKTKI